MDERYFAVEDNDGWTVVDGFLRNIVRIQIPTELVANEIADELNDAWFCFDYFQIETNVTVPSDGSMIASES